MKQKITFKINLSDRDNIRDTIILLKKYIKQLKLLWNKMEVE